MDRQITIKHAPLGLNDLYDKYAGMLLGYIFEIVKDKKQAEQHLVAIYNNLPGHLYDINNGATNAWCLLQRLAKIHLSGLVDGVPVGIKVVDIDLNSYNARNKFLSLMTDEQKQVFCSVYYHGKTTAQLSKELGKTEDSIRKALKEAFVIIKKAS